MDSVYIESTIPSYLTASLPKSLVAAAHQALTREWWDLRRHEFHLFTSQLTFSEVAAGNEEAARLRLAALQGIPVLTLSEPVETIAEELQHRNLMPPGARADGLHIAYAAVHGVTYLLTWNCKHIANAERLPAIESFLDQHGFHVPIVCTPEELLGE